MNIYLWIIVSALLAEFVLHCLSRWLDLKNLSTDLPEEFISHYSPERYFKSQEYFRVNTRFTILTSVIDLIIILSVIILGLFNTLDIFIRSYGYSPLVTGLIFFGILFLIQDILSTPISIYHTFVIEEEFGFNKTTPKTFILDKLKGYVLITILGGGIFYMLLYFFEAFGSLAWLYAWIILSAFLILIQPLFTTFIAPLFNTFTPLEDGDLKNRITRFAIKVNFPIGKIDVMDGSVRSSKANAYFSGIGKKKRIALYDTLIEDHTTKELLSIVAHEVGHYKKGHIIKGMIFSILQSGLMLFLLSVFMNNLQLFAAFKMENVSIYGSFLFFSLLYSPLRLVLSLMGNALSRKHEFEADRFALDNVGFGEDLINGLKKLTVNNLGNLNPHPLTVLLNYSHPPVLQRIKSIRNPV